MFDFFEYARLFNQGDDIAHAERYFTEDFTFIGSSREFRGKQSYLKFLEFAHNGVLERMRPQRVVREGDFIFADIDMDFHATGSRPDFPFGNLHPGDLITVKFFATYKIGPEGKVAELKVMTWAPGKGVTTTPKLGAHPSQQAAFRAYLAAFSNADCGRFSAFYQDDVVLRLNTRPALEGRSAIVDFYKRMFLKVRENFTITRLEATDTAIKTENVTRFTALADAPDFLIMPMSKGEVIEFPVGVDYELKDGLIQTIQTRRLAPPKKVAPAAVTFPR